MAGGKETGRQKMIGMMYLVLTALLAMNVSKEVVNAFVTIDEGQMKSKAALENKLANQRNALERNAKDNVAKYGDARDAANKVGAEAQELIEHIDLIKAKTFAISIGSKLEDPIPPEVFENGTFYVGLDSVKALVGIDNYDNNTNLMIGGDVPSEENNLDGGNYRAAVLRTKLLSFKEMMQNELKQIDDANPAVIQGLVDNLDKTFYMPTKEEDIALNGPDATGWVLTNFYHVPLAASTAILTTLQSQIRNAESDLVDQLYSAVEGQSYKFDELKSAVIPMATTVSAGSNFEANVFLAAYDTKNSPDIFLGNPGVKWDSIQGKLNGESVKLDMEGTVGKVKIPASGLGAQQREGMIVFKSPGMPDRIEPFKIDYSVVAPQLIVSPTKMNVFYKGLPNPVSISVPGFTADKVTPRASAGSLTKGSDGYVMNIKSGNEVNISASVELPDGSSKSMPPVKFRVKKIPDPVPSFGQKGPSDNVIPGTSVRAAQGVRAVMENFDFELSVTVASFKVVTVVNGDIKEAICQGNKLNAQAQGLLGNMRRGQKFSIEEIKVNMPDGVRKVPSISLRII